MAFTDGQIINDHTPGHVKFLDVDMVNKYREFLFLHW